MSTLLNIFVTCCSLIIAASAIQAQHIFEETSWNRDESNSLHVQAAKRPSCVISIPEDEANGLTKLLSGFLNVFTARSETAVVDVSSNASSAFVLNCANGISGMETSVWRILNRVWLATSCQYSDEEFDQALREVEREAGQMLITLSNVDVVPVNDSVKMDYYHSTVATVRATLLQAIEKMKEAQKSGRCHSSAVKQLTANFEEALREIKSQKETIAALQQETRQALSDIKTLKEETKNSFLAVTLQKKESEVLLQRATRQKNETDIAMRTMKRYKDASNRALAIANLKIKLTEGTLEEIRTQTNKTESALEEMRTQKNETESALEEMRMQKNETETALRQMESQKEVTHVALETLRSQVGRTDNALVEVAAQKAITDTVLQAMEAQRKQVNELRSVFDNQTTKTKEALSAVENNSQRFAKEIAELSTENTFVKDTLKLLTRTTEFEEYKANLSQIVGKQAEDCEKAVKAQSDRLDATLMSFKASNNGTSESEAGTPQVETTTDSAKSKTSSSTGVLPPIINPTVAPSTEATTRTAPSVELQTYYNYSFAGLAGRIVNIENEFYKGEYLYLARNPTNRIANVDDDGAILAVGPQKLKESAFQWELVAVPSGGYSAFYLRNKLNQNIPISIDINETHHRRNYIKMEVVSFSAITGATQLAIFMKIHDRYYFLPSKTLNGNPVLQGREILWSDIAGLPGRTWIITFTS